MYKKWHGREPATQGEGFIMKTAILGSVLLFAIPLAAPAAESDLYGTWKLVSTPGKWLIPVQWNSLAAKPPAATSASAETGA